MKKCVDFTLLLKLILVKKKKINVILVCKIIMKVLVYLNFLPLKFVTGIWKHITDIRVQAMGLLYRVLIIYTFKHDLFFY